MRSTVISRWPDGSASVVVVVAGETSVSLGAPKQNPLAGRRRWRFDSVDTRKGSAVAGFQRDRELRRRWLRDVRQPAATPSKVWWANERVICCRYRAPIGTHPTLEAVVEHPRVLIESGAGRRSWSRAARWRRRHRLSHLRVRTPPRSALTARRLRRCSRLGAPGGPTGRFEPGTHRVWVGGDPWHRRHTRHRFNAGSSAVFPGLEDLAAAWRDTLADAYQAWGVGRHPASDMGGVRRTLTQLGPLPKWEVQYLQTGDNQARRAVIASALSVLSFNVNYRDSGAGLCADLRSVGEQEPTASRKPTQARAWPNNAARNLPGGQAHHPAAGLTGVHVPPVARVHRDRAEDRGMERIHNK